MKRQSRIIHYEVIYGGHTRLIL